MHIKITIFMFILASFLNQLQSQNSHNTIMFNAANFSLLRDKYSGIGIANFVRRKNKYLKVIVLGKQCVFNVGKCAQECVTRFGCYSFNFGLFPTCNDQYGCELLRDNMFSKPDNFSDSNNHDHFALMVSFIGLLYNFSFSYAHQVQFHIIFGPFVGERF